MQRKTITVGHLGKTPNTSQMDLEISSEGNFRLILKQDTGKRTFVAGGQFTSYIPGLSDKACQLLLETIEKGRAVSHNVGIGEISAKFPNRLPF
jgi:hypothetical protein